MAEPRSIVSPAEWEEARQALLVREKDLTRAADVLAAARRRMPMMRLASDYALEGPDGQVRLVDAFEGGAS